MSPSITTQWPNTNPPFSEVVLTAGSTTHVLRFPTFDGMSEWLGL